MKIKQKKYQVLVRSILLLLLLSTTAFISCRSHDLSKYPPTSRTLFLYNFTNDSFEPDANRDLFRATRAELLRRGNFLVSKDKNAAVLRVYGDIVAFRKRGLMFDDLRSPVRLEYTMVCRIKIYQNTDLLVSEEVGARIAFSSTEGARETKQNALRRLSRKVAQRINNVLEQQYINLQNQ